MNALKRIWQDAKVKRVRAKLRKIDAQRSVASRELKHAKKIAAAKLRKKTRATAKKKKR